MTDTDTAGLKQLGDAHLYLRGMQSNVGMKSVPADMVVFDELDEAAPAAKTMAVERLAHSDYKRVIELSNPSLPDYGIDEQYQQSDQRHWTMKCPGCGTWTAMDKEFPKKLGEDARVLRPRADGSVYRACPRCSGELDTEVGEWVADFPGRSIRGYRISQLFSSKVDPGEILRDYRKTRYPERFYNLKIGIPWTDTSRRLDASSVLALCRDSVATWPRRDTYTTMGVDTGRDLHVVILRSSWNDEHAFRLLVHLEVCQSFPEIDSLMERFAVHRCVIDGLPETHATREFAKRHHPNVYMCFFNEHQRGAPKWDRQGHAVTVNRTEALDSSRMAVRESELVIPRQLSKLDLFADQMSCDAKILEEDEETGIKKFRYIRTGANHFSMAFTYAWLAASKRPGRMVVSKRRLI